jgi:hypothetical protein
MSPEMRNPDIMNRFLLTIALAIFSASSLPAADGKWTPQQVREIDPVWLKKQGLEISPEKLWNPKRGTGLLAATVNVGGCSGGFVSPSGLFITNHHCLFSVLQEHSTPQNDIITNGFLARDRSAELPSKSLRLLVARKYTDVTSEIEASVPASASDIQRTRAIEAKQRAMVESCEKQKATKCRVAAFDGGVHYTLIESTEFSDVRLVYAPPRAVGEFGGEIDNWMWPRHTGDFAIGRVYVGADGVPAANAGSNVPYKPAFHFPISTRGVDEGDFVMVLGYPGTTYRAFTADEMLERRDYFFRGREELYGEWISILEESTKGNPEAEIRVADTLKTLHNRAKNATGQLAGFKRGNLLEKQRASDEAVLAWASKNPRYAQAVAARAELKKVVDDQLSTFQRDWLLSTIPVGGKSMYHATTPYGMRPLYFAVNIAQLAKQRQKPEAERGSFWTEKGIASLSDRFEREQKNYYEPADKQIFASFVRRALTLPQGQRIAAIDRVFGGSTSAEAVTAKIDELYAATKVTDPAQRVAMMNETEEQLRARRDPLIDLGFALDAELQRLLDRQATLEGAVTRLRPVWRKAVMAQAGRPIAPDANSTLRVSFAHVKGYEPRDGVMYVPQTSLSGILEKQTGEEPFDAPDTILAAANAKKFGRWVDRELGDVPVNFLSDADTTGGNSGSPTVNGRGELVGVNFDRVWENVANDFGYNPDIARNVNVDIRYLLWVLDQVEDADALLRELGVRH